MVRLIISFVFFCAFVIAQSQELKLNVKTHSSGVSSIKQEFAISNSGRYLIMHEPVKKNVSDFTPDYAEYRIIDLKNLEVASKIQTDNKIYGNRFQLLFSGDERNIVLAELDMIEKKTLFRFFDVATGQEEWRREINGLLSDGKSANNFGSLAAPLPVIAFTPDDRGIVAIMGLYELYLLDRESGNISIRDYSEILLDDIPKDILKEYGLENECEVSYLKDYNMKASLLAGIQRSGDYLVLSRNLVCLKHKLKAKEYRSPGFASRILARSAILNDIILNNDLDPVKAKNIDFAGKIDAVPVPVYDFSNDTITKFTRNYGVTGIKPLLNFEDLLVQEMNASGDDTRGYVISGKIGDFFVIPEKDWLFFKYFQSPEHVLYDLKNQEPVVRIFNLDDNIVFITPDNYYKSNQKIYESLSFSRGLRSYSFGQFDVRFNRPDIVMERIGFADAQLIDLYRNAYYKRLNHLGISEEVFEGEISLPEIKVSGFVEETRSRTANYTVSASDDLYPLKSIHVLINGVPVFGSSGIPVPGNQRSFEKTMTLELESGRNMVEFYSRNINGYDSQRERVVTMSEAPAEPSLYLIAIGVSEFLDSDYNLTYAAKDARDITSLFRSNEKLFSNIILKKYSNEQVSQDIVHSIKQDLSQTKPDDYVIVFFATHGLLSPDLDYYLASHHTDFSNPSDGGILYEDVESIFEDVRARNRLLLIDACHSGEIDKEEGIAFAAVDPDASNVKQRGFKAVTSSSVGLENSFELMKELFLDVRDGTGSIVIAAAGGKEFAYESEKWQNGVFTYALLEGISTGNADADRDGTISVMELYRYIGDQVQRLTGGKQVPTTRNINVYKDFPVW